MKNFHRIKEHGDKIQGKKGFSTTYFIILPLIFSIFHVSLKKDGGRKRIRRLCRGDVRANAKKRRFFHNVFCFLHKRDVY